MISLQWTARPPEEPGWYWVRLFATPFKVQVVEVVNWPGGGLAVHAPSFSEARDGWTTPERCDYEWLGPLLPPDPKVVSKYIMNVE